MAVDLHDHSCYNTRAKALVRDSLTQTVPVPADHCFIESGKWYDPYSGSVFANAQDIVR